MTYKVVRDSSGAVVAFGENTENYEPVVAAGCALSIEDLAPDLIIHAAQDSPMDKIKRFLADNPDVVAIL